MIQDRGLKIARSEEAVVKRMTFLNGEKPGFKRFLKKFDILNEIAWDADLVAKSIAQVVWDIAGDKIEYAEVDFTIGKYQKSLGWSDEDIIVYIADKFEEESTQWGVRIGLILCLKYEAPRKEQKKIAGLITNPKVAERLVGIDLVGDEANFSKPFYAPIFRLWKSAGKGIVAHVGESQPATNVKDAIEMGVDRIAHGIRVPKEMPELLPIIKERGIAFEIAPSSNLLTGVVKDMRRHPVKEIIESGAAVTIGTDDPTVCNTRLDREYSLVYEQFPLWWPDKSKSKYEEIMMDIMANSMAHAFDPEIRNAALPTQPRSNQ